MIKKDGLIADTLGSADDLTQTDILGPADDLTKDEILILDALRQLKSSPSTKQDQILPPVPANADKIIARLAARERRELPKELQGLAVFADVEGNPPNTMRLDIDPNNPWSQLLVPMYFLESDPRIKASIFTSSEISHSSQSTTNPFDAAFTLIKHSINATMKEAKEMHEPNPEAIAAQVKKIIVDALRLDAWPISVAIYVTGRGGYIDVMTGYVLDYINAKPVPYALQEMERQLREFKSWNERIIRSKILAEASAFGIFATVTETTTKQKEVLAKLEEKNIDPMLAQVAKSIEIRTKRMKESSEILHEMYHLMYNNDFSDEVQKLSQMKRSNPRYIIGRRRLKKQIETIIAIIHRPKTDIWEEVYKKKLGNVPPESTREKLKQIIEENYTERSLNLLGLRKSTAQEEIIDFSRDRTLVVDIGGSNYVQIKYYDKDTDKLLSFEEIYASLEQETKKYKSKLQRTHRNQVDEKPRTILSRIVGRLIDKKETQEDENPVQLDRIKEYIQARKNTAAVLRELFNFHDKNTVIRSRGRLKQFISGYANASRNSKQVTEIVENIQLLSKADFSVVIDLGLPISNKVHGGECIAQLGTGSQTLVFTTGSEPVQLSNKDIVGRLYNGINDRLKPAKSVQLHSIHSTFDGTDAIIIGEWLQTEVFKALEALANQENPQLSQTPIPEGTITPLPLGLNHDALTNPEGELTVFTEPRTSGAFEVTAESELPEHLIETPHELNDQLLEIVKTTIKHKIQQELSVVQTLVDKKDRSQLVKLLRRETDLFIDRAVDQEFQKRFEIQWNEKVKKYSDESSYYEIENEKNELEQQILQEVFTEAQNERSELVKVMNVVINKIYTHQKNLVEQRIQHQQIEQNIVTKYDSKINILTKWTEKLKTSVDDFERNRIEQILLEITKGVKHHLLKRLQRLNEQNEIGQIRLDTVIKILDNNPEFLSIPDAIRCYEIQRDLELELEANKYIQYNQGQNNQIEAGLPLIQEHLNKLLKLKYGNPDVDPNHPDYSPILKMYGKANEGGANLGKMNTAGISGVGMLFWAIANDEIPAVRMLVDLKKTKAGGRLEYLTLSATSTTADRFSTFNETVNTNDNVDASEVYKNWELLVQEMMQIAGFNFQLLVQHAQKGVSYATTVTVGADKIREKLLNFMTKNLNEKLNSLYYVPHQLSFLHTNPRQNQASGFYSVPAPENVRTSVGAVYNHDPENRKLSYSFRIPINEDDLVKTAQEMGIDINVSTEEQRLEIRKQCEINLAKRADDITSWQTFSHAMTKLNKEKITKLCENWNALPDVSRKHFENNFLNYMLAGVVEQNPLKA